MRTEARRVESDSDGLDRLQRQRRAVRLNTWIDRDTGMGRWSATWDPETMVRLENRLDAQVQAMFHDTQPDDCPSDLLEKQSFLQLMPCWRCNGGGAVGSTRSSSSTTPPTTPTGDRLGITRRFRSGFSTTCISGGGTVTRCATV